MDKQSRRDSLIEAVVNTFIGFVITCIVSPFLYWIVDVRLNVFQLGTANLLFTLVSVIRNYFVRRYFASGKIFTIKPKHHVSKSTGSNTTHHRSTR
jgi:hypothetical protein